MRVAHLIHLRSDWSYPQRHIRAHAGSVYAVLLLVLFSDCEYIGDSSQQCVRTTRIMCTLAILTICSQVCHV